MMWSELEYVLVGRQVDKMAVGKAPSDDGKSLSKTERNSDMIVFLCTKGALRVNYFPMGGKESCVGFANDGNTSP